jgi:hypothetical protein
VLIAEWQPIAYPSAVIPLCQYNFPVCIKLRPKDFSSLGSYLPPSLTFTPVLALRSQYTSIMQQTPVSILVGHTTLNLDIACANITILPQLFHAGFMLSVSIHVW